MVSKGQDHSQTSFRRGVMSLVILALLKREDMYGYQRVQECEGSSNGALVTQEDSLYPVLYKLLDAGMVSAYRVKSGKCMTRVYYYLEPAGEVRLEELIREYTDTTLRLMGIDPNEADEQVNEEEILMMVDAGSEKSAIDEQEKEFIQNVFEFDDLTAEEIAVHRTEVTILWMEDDLEEWARTIHDSRHTLYPVCEGSPDNIIGILNAKDYFRLDDRSRENVMKQAVKEPFFVPETIKADVLFRKMKKTRNAMAIVLDEYGGMVGIITLNDLIEQLVGDLGEDTPEEEAAEPHIDQMDENTWAIIGNVELYDIEDIGLEEVDTFTGLVFGELDMIPSDGNQNIELDFKGLHIQIIRVEDHQIAYAKVTKLSQSAEDALKEY